MKKIILILILINFQLYCAQKAALGLNINTSDLEIEAKTSLAFNTNHPVYRNFFIDANYISAEDSLVGFGLFVQNHPTTNNTNLTYSIGLRGVFTDHSGDDFTALPIYLATKARILKGHPSTHIGFKVSYAPSPLTFSDAQLYREYRIEIDSTIIENVNIYIGYRSIRTDYEDFDIDYNSGIYAGFRFVLE